MAGFVDMKGIQAKSTWGEFRQMNQIDNTIVKRYRPEAFPNGSTGSGKENFCNWRVYKRTYSVMPELRSLPRTLDTGASRTSSRLSSGTLDSGWSLSR
jgi:hypothetical protein